ncbi:hypothetical protein P3X46_014675 [Hevea brasiliensis]|uniref:Growth-regulating factor n=1 Tax=Hevea brasiliensis TaxID=3981 RepID=A0ABQ9LTF3_HEVBR|nr:hypothetical protein P3X46_014675 [Hevea brasiliensis]
MDPWIINWAFSFSQSIRKSTLQDNPKSPASSQIHLWPRNSDDKVRTLVTEVKKGDDHQVREGAASSSMKVCIGIGDDDRGPVIRHGKALLTEAQLCELQRQLIIYKYSAAGLPVQVLPFWKSVSSSFGFVNGGICRLYPSCIPQEFDINKMDPEPGRCRRSVGKKWRCKKNVVSGQKYCEQHKHGGRQCSRKPVEASQTITASNATPLKNSSKTSQNPNTSDCTSTTAVLSNGTRKSHKNYGTTCCSVDAKIIGCTTKAVIVVSC